MTTPVVLEVITELDGHRARFEEFCRSLSPEELDRQAPKSTWFVRDFIAHLATIDIPVGEMFRAIHRGEDAGMRTPDGARVEIDNWNEQQVVERRKAGVESLLGEAARARRELTGHLKALTEEDLARTLKFAGDSKRAAAEIPLGAYLRGWCKHDPMHAIDMCRALPHWQSELAPWFDDPVVQGYQRAMNK
ncbi:MAG: DinB family protein [Dehalococcoidia bacterium]|nr:DinB family protein [Dehalococcoidia bacterium]